jgi:hypothetical protein
MEDAVHAASLVVSGRPLASVTSYLAARSRQEVREMVAALESHRAAEDSRAGHRHGAGAAAAGDVRRRRGGGGQEEAEARER